jgi:hypothetical protein
MVGTFNLSRKPSVVCHEVQCEDRDNGGNDQQNWSQRKTSLKRVPESDSHHDPAAGEIQAIANIWYGLPPGRHVKSRQTMKLFLIALAVAHSWYTGYHDPVTGYECCDDKKDCGVINPRYVEPLPGGDFNVRTGSKTLFFIPKNRVIESEDSQYHICLSPPFSYIRCFFAPHTEASR